MFCGKCGTQIPDGAAFCPSCGNAVAAQPAVNQAETVTALPKKKVNTNTIVGIVAVAAVVVAVAIILISIFAGGGSGSGSPEAVVEKYMEASLDFDIDRLLECMHDDVIKQAADELYDGDVKELKAELKEDLDEAKEYMELLGSEIELSYKIVDSTSIKGDNFDDIAEDFKDEFDLKISAAAIVDVEQSTSGEILGEIYDETNEMSVIVVKIDGKWYIHPEDFDIG